MSVTESQRLSRNSFDQMGETGTERRHLPSPFGSVLMERTEGFDGAELEEFLHDFVVQDLVALSLNLELLVSRANSLIGRIREVVEHGNSSPATLERVIQVASASFDGLATCAIHVHPASNMLLDRELLYDVSCVIREAVSNAVRHGDSTAVRIFAQTIGDELQLEIEDDGCGIDESAIGIGNGTRNMTARASRRGGSCRIARSPHGGTTVAWKVPTKEERND
jgi:glucose-6-phosphate-specific signal transduction histidine kinase